MTKKTKVRKAWIRKPKDEETASKILRTVPYNNAFYFFTDVEQYSGKFASSLSDFCQRMKTIDVKSVDFHFERRDFQKWIGETLGDIDLANEINKIRKEIHGEGLRDKIYHLIQRRLTKLRKLLASEDAYLEHV